MWNITTAHVSRLPLWGVAFLTLVVYNLCLLHDLKSHLIERNCQVKINKDKCVGCANCVPVCSVGAIFIDDDGLGEINPETCVECHNCHRSLSPEHLPPGPTRLIRKILKSVSLRFQPDPDVCPTDAFAPEDLEWPRIVRRAFSDPMVTHESTGVHGRGTEAVSYTHLTLPTSSVMCRSRWSPYH